DEVTVGIDADQNPDTGGVFYGAEFEVSLFGTTSKFLAAGPSGYYDEAPKPSSFRASFADGAATFSFLASEVAVGPGFKVYALGFGAGSVDTAPEIRTFNYQLVSGKPPPVLGPDRRGPLDEAVKSTGTHGKTARLYYFAADG